MRLCDICKTNGAHYEDYAIINKAGDSEKLELCKSCYRKLSSKTYYYNYLAYKETVEEITGEKPKEKRRLFGIWITKEN
jgi:ribosome-binding protein aMBF1 (putative translation factor)